MIEVIINGFQTSLMYLGVVAIVPVSVSFVILNWWRLIRLARKIRLAQVARGVQKRIKRSTVVVLVGFAAVCTIYGGYKGWIRYPYTDYELRYLVDNGSYVSNDLVHVSFTRIVVPASAPFYISFRQVDSTNDLDWVVYTNTTFAAFQVPCDFRYENATNYDWIGYTTWTPGPTVQTNGVWHSYWGKDKKLHTHFIPVRSSVRVDGETIATPKSKREANQ